MHYKGRTVLLIALMAMLTGSILTVVLSDQFNTSIFAREHVDQPGNEQGSDDKQGASANKGLSQSDVNKLLSSYQLIYSQFYKDVDTTKVIDGAIQGMLMSLDDPYSTYMDAEQADHFQNSVIESTFSGIGAEVTMQNGRVTVVAPIKDSPAEKAGIRAKDQILSINGEALDGLSLTEAVMKIRGKKGTQAKLVIAREGNSNTIEIIVVRDDIDIETVYSEMMDGNIGKIEIRQFAQNTDEHFEDAVNKLEAEGMKGLIIDVRNNPGGILPVVVNMADLFIEEGSKPIVQVEYRDGRRQQYKAAAGGKDYPVIVVTNKGSASASEILAVSLQEATGATVVGEATFGKSTVQYTYNTSAKDGSNIKLTVAEWLTPDGNSVAETGVVPDVEVKLPDIYYAAPLPKDKILESDMVGDDIKQLQLMLEALGFEPDRNDGYFSEGTVQSLKAFQETHDLEPTGKVDEETAVAIESEIIEYLSKPESDLQMQKAKSLMEEMLRQ